MRISDMLKSIASWLENPDNEAFVISEYDENCLNIVANSCIEAASILRNAADQVDLIEPVEESKINSDSLDKLAAIAETFDESEDPELKAQASVLDELLLTIAAAPDLLSQKKADENKRLDDLKRQYEKATKEFKEDIREKEALKAIKESKMTEAEIYQGGLSTRTCPDHPGAQMMRVDDQTWKCGLDGKNYNYFSGFTLDNGMKVPGGDVANQTKMEVPEMSAIFDTRDSRLGSNS